MKQKLIASQTLHLDATTVITANQSFEAEKDVAQDLLSRGLARRSDAPEVSNEGFADESDDSVDSKPKGRK